MSKKALLIGINYFDTSSQLNGCHNDVDAVHELLVNIFGFRPENVEVLKDTPGDSNHKLADCPTRRNIVASMKELVKNSVAGDTLFVHYSGHGSWTKDLNGEEPDKRDEMICTVDDNQILDDELNQMLVKDLPAGVKLRCLFDSCHSGSVLDLPYSWNFLDRAKLENERMVGTEKDCMMISGCRDPQTSADAWISGDAKYQGAMTWGFLKSLNEAGLINVETKDDAEKKVSWKNVLINMRTHLKNGGYEQIPQWAFCSKPQIKQLFDL